MAIQLPPIPNNPITDVFVWRDWFYKVSQSIIQQASITWSSIDFTGSNIQDIQTRQHNALQSIQGGIGGQYYHLTATQYSLLTNAAYGSFSNNANQLVNSNAATVVILNTVDTANLMSLASNRISISQTGVFNVQFSLQLVNTDSQAHEAWIWLRKNNIDVTGTASKYDVPSTHGSSDGYLIAVANFFITVNSGDYIEVVWSTDQAKVTTPPQNGVYIEAYSAVTLPYPMPAVPSSVVTVTRVS